MTDDRPFGVFGRPWCPPGAAVGPQKAAFGGTRWVKCPRKPAPPDRPLRPLALGRERLGGAWKGVKSEGEDRVLTLCSQK